MWPVSNPHQGRQALNGSRETRWSQGGIRLARGRADLGETIPECVERELFEETNIKAKYRHILYFREQDKNMYGSVDIYFACMVDCEEEALQKIVT